MCVVSVDWHVWDAMNRKNCKNDGGSAQGGSAVCICGICIRCCHSSQHGSCERVSMQGIGARVRRDTLRKTWVPTGEEMRALEKRGIYIRFVIGYRHARPQPAVH